MPQSKLEAAIAAAEATRPGRLPRALPLGHVARASGFSSILSSRELKPTHCKVMRGETLYLFYGGLSYRSKSNPTQEETSYPIGLLFSPKILQPSDVHYPFDTGAVAAAIYTGPPAKNFKRDYVVSADGFGATEPSVGPRLIVKHLFADNRNYLAGKSSTDAINKPHPIPTLHRFYTAPNDRSDHRRACIETQRHSPLKLNDELIWLGYPEIFSDDVNDFLRKRESDLPIETWAYPSYARFKPSELCGVLHGRASTVLEKFVPRGAE